MTAVRRRYGSNAPEANLFEVTVSPRDTSVRKPKQDYQNELAE